jgi:hypothetical protein
MEKELSRRDFLARALALGLAGVGASAVLAACGNAEQKPEQKPATPPAASPRASSSATTSPALVRAGQGHAHQQPATWTSPPPLGRTCANCQLYQPAAAGACGACTLVKGPIHPEGLLPRVGQEGLIWRPLRALDAAAERSTAASSFLALNL